MAALLAFNGHASVTVNYTDADLGRMMDNVRDRIEAGEGFWANSGGDDRTGAQTLWVPPGSMVQFRFDPQDE